jgi:hypothetical protein
MLVKLAEHQSVRVVITTVQPIGIKIGLTVLLYFSLTKHIERSHYHATPFEQVVQNSLHNR